MDKEVANFEQLVLIAKKIRIALCAINENKKIELKHLPCHPTLCNDKATNDLEAKTYSNGTLIAIACQNGNLYSLVKPRC